MTNYRVSHIDDLIALLVEARALHNQTVKDAKQVDRWHKAVDAALAHLDSQYGHDRWDDPQRVAYRGLVKRLYKEGS